MSARASPSPASVKPTDQRKVTESLHIVALNSRSSPIGCGWVRALFRDAVRRELASGLEVRIVLPSVLALLKLTDYLDSRPTRQKDLPDHVTLMIRYKEDGDRRFSGAVLDA